MFSQQPEAAGMSHRFEIRAGPCVQAMMRLFDLIAQRDKPITSIEMRKVRRQSRISIGVAGLSSQDAQIIAAKMRCIVGVAAVDLVGAQSSGK